MFARDGWSHLPIRFKPPDCVMPAKAGIQWEHTGRTNIPIGPQPARDVCKRLCALHFDLLGLAPSIHEPSAAPCPWPLGPRVKREDVKFWIYANVLPALG